MTPKVMKRIRSRSGNAAPATVVSGMASAAASETTPRTPTKARMNAHCQGGDGSRRASDGLNQRGR